MQTTPTAAAQERFDRIRSKADARLIEVHADGGIEFAIELAGHWTHFAIAPDGGRARMLG